MGPIFLPFLSNFNWKNMISTHTKNFSGKSWTEFLKFGENSTELNKNFQIDKI
jgi:hypothetical protein